MGVVRTLPPGARTAMRPARLPSVFLALALLALPRDGRSSPDGVCAPSHVATIGSFGSGQGEFNNPVSVCALPSGEIAVVDFWNSRVQLFATDGAFLSECGVGELIVAVDSDDLGRLFVLTWSGKVYRSNPYGVVERTWLPPERDGYYLGRDLDVHGDQVYVAANGNTVTRFTLEGVYLGDIPTKTGMLGIAVGTTGDLYATNENDHDVCRYSTSGQLLGCWGSHGSGPQQFDGPHGMAIAPGGYLLIADEYNDRISVWTESGQFVCTWGASGSAPDQFQFAGDVAVGPGGEYYVCDLGNDRVHRFGSVPTAAVRRSWGQLKALYR